jgi:hypothetical protein
MAQITTSKTPNPPQTTAPKGLTPLETAEKNDSADVAQIAKASEEKQPVKEKGFFDDFHPPKNHRYINKLLVLPIALVLVVVAFLFKPTIEAIFHPSKNPDLYSPVSNEPKSMHLTINNPDDQVLTQDHTLVVSGQTSPKSGVVINVNYPNSNSKDLNIGVEADDKGEFHKSVDLKTGVNEITISAFDPQGNNKVETREIYYTEEKL